MLRRRGALEEVWARREAIHIADSVGARVVQERRRRSLWLLVSARMGHMTGTPWLHFYWLLVGDRAWWRSVWHRILQEGEEVWEILQ